MTDWLSVWIFATPVLALALGELVVERAGIVNIGAEGQALLAAFVAAYTSHATGSAWLGVGAGIAVGAFTALVAAGLIVKAQADQVIVGTATTLIALGLTSFWFRSTFGQSADLPSVPTVRTSGGLDPIAVGCIVLAIVIWVALQRTTWGLRIRAAGEFPDAIASIGASVERLRIGALVIGGAMAGLAGAYLSVGIAGSFSENMTQGRGFVAIAMVTFGRWKPGWVVASCLFMGWLESLQFTAQARGWNAPFQLFLAAPYLVGLIALAAIGKQVGAPAALGKPYRSQR